MTSIARVYDIRLVQYPIGSMYGIFTYIYHKNQPNVGKYTIHGSYGYRNPYERLHFRSPYIL